MFICVLRHGIAEDRRPGRSDGERKLTAEGKAKLLRVLARAREAGVAPALILSSPLVRAVETAELAAGALGYKGRIAHTEALLPDASPAALWEEIRTRKPEGELLVAGHEPNVSSLVAYLLASPGLRMDFKKGALARLESDAFDPHPRCVLKWVLTPALAG
jgi:phosphohistidine phosphatase